MHSLPNIHVFKKIKQVMFSESEIDATRWLDHLKGKLSYYDVLSPSEMPTNSICLLGPFTQIEILRCFFFLLYNIVLVLPYINMNPPWVYTFSPSCTPLLPLSPYHPSGSSQCTSPEHPVSCIEPGLVIHFTYGIIHDSVPKIYENGS